MGRPRKALTELELDEYADVLSPNDVEVLGCFVIDAGVIPKDITELILRRTATCDMQCKRCNIPHWQSQTIAARLITFGLIDIGHVKDKKVILRSRLAGVTPKGIEVLRHIETLEEEDVYVSSHPLSQALFG